MKDNDQIYEVLFEMFHERGKWFYVGTFTEKNDALNKAIDKEIIYRLQNPPKYVHRFQIIHKQKEKILHVYIYVRPVCYQTENKFEQIYMKIANFISRI